MHKISSNNRGTDIYSTSTVFSVIRILQYSSFGYYHNSNNHVIR